MDQNLRVLFEQALDDEPVPPAGNLAQEAMVRGTALRRRRNLLAAGGAAGVVAIVATLVALSTVPNGGRTSPEVVGAALVPPVNAACTFPAQWRAAEVRVFLRQEITDEERLDLLAALQSDALVRDVTFRSREQAHATFRQMYKDSPDLIEAVTTDQFPESFHVEFTKPTEYQAFVAKFDGTPGVDLIQGTTCPADSGSGEGE